VAEPVEIKLERGGSPNKLKRFVFNMAMAGLLKAEAIHGPLQADQQNGTMNAYVYEFLDMHRQEMVGNFFVDSLAAVPTKEGETMAIEFDCWLAPYDFGVSQSVRLITVPLGDEDLETFRLTLRRKSGDVHSWLRTNREFLNELRKALLVWRTMTTEGRAHYEEVAKELFSSWPAVEETPP